jgi:hypothetical protein
VQLGLRHRPLQAEQQPVVDRRGVVETVLVADERVGEGAELEEAVPVGVVARQARALEAQHDACLVERDVGNEALEALPICGRRPGLALVDIDDDHLLALPAEGDRPARQVVLASGGLGVVGDLVEAGLAHVEVGIAPCRQSPWSRCRSWEGPYRRWGAQQRGSSGVGKCHLGDHGDDLVGTGQGRQRGGASVDGWGRGRRGGRVGR